MRTGTKTKHITTLNLIRNAMNDYDRLPDMKDETLIDTIKDILSEFEEVQDE